MICEDKLGTTLYSKYPINILARVGSNGEPIATPLPLSFLYLDRLNLNPDLLSKTKVCVKLLKKSNL